jgi:pyruvate,orthophosphate dikinase
MEMCVRLGRQTKPDLEIGICGEHGGEPSSVQFCYRIARLAAAQAAISGDKAEAMRTA